MAASGASARERLDELGALRSRVAALEAEIARLRDAAADAGGRPAGGAAAPSGPATALRQADQLLALERDLAIQLSQTSDLFSVLDQLLDATMRIEGIDCGAVYLVDEASGSLHVVSIRGVSGAFAEGVRTLGADSRHGRIVHAGQPVYLEYELDAAPLDPIDALRQREGLRAVACLPVHEHGRIRAALHLASRSEPRIPAAARAAAEAIAALIGGALARVRATTALRLTQANLQNLFDALDDMLFVVNESGCLVHANPVVERRLGYSAAELRGMTVPELHPPELRDAARQIIADILAGRRRTCPIPLWTRAGERIPVDTRVVRGEWDGRAVCFGISRDVSERKRTEDALRESEERFRQMAESVGQVFWMRDVGRDEMLYVSPAYEEVWGRPCRELYERPAAWLDAVVPEDRPRVARCFAQLGRDRTEEQEYRIQRADGAVRWIRDRAFPVRDSGETVRRVAGIAEDITERKAAEAALRESERRFREALESSRHWLYRFNVKADRYDYISPCAAEMMGYALEEVVSAGSAQLTAQIHPDDWPRVEAVVREAAAQRRGPRASVTLEYRRRTRSGDYRWLSDWTTLLFDPAGALEAVVGSAYDITEQKRAEHERRELEAQLRHAQKIEAVGLLAGGVAHDFNNLLASIYGYVDLARDTLDPDHPAMRTLDRVAAAAEQAAGVTRALLTFSRKAPTEKEPVELQAVVTRSADLLRRLLPASIELRTDVPPEPPILVIGDNTQLQQVVMNLAINARDAMPRGGRLTIELRPVPADAGASQQDRGEGGPRVQLVIRDNGVGMAPELQERIFEPFFSTKPEGQGTGLGLSILHGIVREHGGTVSVRSAPGRGATFVVELPCQVTGEPPPAAAPPRARHGEGEVILLAESNPHVRRILASALTSLEYEVLSVPDGDALLAHFRAEQARVRLLVTDLDMPRPHGLEWLRAIRAAGCRIPAIAITAGLDPTLEDDLDEETVLLRKPFQLATLGALVARLLESIDRRPALE